MAPTFTLLTCDESSLIAASTSPWLLSSACALASSPLTTPEQGRELARRLSLLLPERPQLQPVLLALCRRFGLLQGLRLELPDAQLLPSLRAAHQLLAAGSEPLCAAAVELGQLLPLLSHPSAAVRGQAAQLVCGRLRTSDASRAAFLSGAIVADPAAATPLLLPREAAAAEAARSTPLELASPVEGALPEGLASVGSELVVAAGTPDLDRGEIVPTPHA